VLCLSFVLLFADVSVYLKIGRCKFQIGIQDATSAALLPISQTVLHGIGLLKNNVWFSLQFFFHALLSVHYVYLKIITVCFV
jgi:hypothetical protein